MQAEEMLCAYTWSKQCLAENKGAEPALAVVPNHKAQQGIHVHVHVDLCLTCMQPAVLEQHFFLPKHGPQVIYVPFFSLNFLESLA